MRLAHLHIQQFRNLQQVELDASSGVNLIIGQNATGKTSLLEAIYYLSHVRSFRTQHISDLINHQASFFELFARLHQGEGALTPVGIRRSKQKLQIRLNQQNIKRVADIAACFPVLAIHPDSYRLITAGPAERRQFIDWGVFHVEQGFFQAWQRYKRAVTQRNAAFRSGQPAKLCQLWDRELDETAARIDALRRDYVQQLAPVLQNLVSRFFPEREVVIEYRRGWAADSSLLAVLQQNLERDRRRGHTSAGPHRADLYIRVDGQSAQTGISRGQQKMLVALLRLAQAMVFSQANNKPCVLLYDDLPAELDASNRQKIIKVIQSMRVQLFVTAIEPDQVDISAWKHKKMFHVEQGRLQELV